MIIDWNAPLELSDGTPVKLIDKSDENGWVRVKPDGLADLFFMDNGYSHIAWKDEAGGRTIRNRPTQSQPTPEQEAVAFAKKMAGLSGVGPLYSEARRIVARMEPEVDRDVLTARHIIAEAQPLSGEGPAHAKRYRNGDWDTDTCIKECVSALRRARNEGDVK